MNEIELQWKEYSVNLDKLTIYLKAHLSNNFDGLICTEQSLKVIFLDEIQESDQNAVESYWSSINSNTFNPTLQEIIEGKINDASIFGKKVIRDAAVENVAMGITQMGKTKAVADYCAKLQNYLETGSLYAALDELDTLILAGAPAPLNPFITEVRLNAYKSKIQSYLGL